MSVRQVSEIASGFTAALVAIFPRPVFSNRAPTVTDKAVIGTQWVDKIHNAYYVLTSITNNQANWLNLGGGDAHFTSITVDPGDVTIVSGDLVTDAGDVISGGTVTSADGVTATTGNIAALNGSFEAFDTNNNSGGAKLEIAKSHGTNGLVHVGDTLGQLIFYGYDGTVFDNGAFIQSVVASGTPGAGNIPSDLEFYTHPDAAGPAIQRMVISEAGNVTIDEPDTGTGLTVSQGITATSGAIQAETGPVAGTMIIATGDGGSGIASENAITNVINTTQGGGTLTIASTNGNNGLNTGFIKIYVGTSTAYIPYFHNIAP